MNAPLCVSLEVNMVTTKFAVRSIARRYQRLSEKILELDEALNWLAAEAAPELVAVEGISTDTAASLLTAAGDNAQATVLPFRSSAPIRSSISSAASCCGYRTIRHTPWQSERASSSMSPRAGSTPSRPLGKLRVVPRLSQRAFLPRLGRVDS